MTALSMKNKVITAALLVFACATSSFAELRSVQFTPEEKSNEGLKAYIGFGGGNSMIIDDGTIFMNLRIGIEFNSFIAAGAWFSTILSDVRNYSAPVPEMVDYNAFGLQAEVTPFRHNFFSISIPVNIGGGAVNLLRKGDEAFSSEDYFFVVDASAQFNFKVTKRLELSVGGGYRLFAGVEASNLKSGDFNTPFGEVRFTFKE